MHGPETSENVVALHSIMVIGQVGYVEKTLSCGLYLQDLAQ